MFGIDRDITKAETLPSYFYKDKEVWSLVEKKIFLPSWQFVAHKNELLGDHFAYPFSFLKPLIDEPLVLVQKNTQEFHILSNICTHRANVIVTKAGNYRELVCKYHGRAFDLDGCFKRMPQFKETKNFPTERDHLMKLQHRTWNGLHFAGLMNGISFEHWIHPMIDRISWIGIEKFQSTISEWKTFKVRAHWALYCENYLEGFHIPFVHPELNQELSIQDYATELYDWGVLQIGYGKDGDVCFEIPENSADYGKKVAAYYFWLFPNLMFNFYPWGLSINIVRPVHETLTEVDFRYYVGDSKLMSVGAGANLDLVEFQDEEVVESVQKGISSVLYNRGRYSPAMEKGVHHFHVLLDQILNSHT